MQNLFLDPVLAECGDRTNIPKRHTPLGVPEDWFHSDRLAEHSLAVSSFDFFVDWGAMQLKRELWQKKILNLRIGKSLESLTEKEITKALRTDQSFVSLARFAKSNEFKAVACIIDDTQDWSSDSACLIFAKFDPGCSHGLTFQKSLLPEVMARISKESGGDAPIGRKGLRYGTSRLECFLSRTTSLWPGDVDSILWRKDEPDRPIALLEFKKHTSRSRIGFSDQKLSNYYPNPDRKKYDRLGIFAQQAIPNFSIPTFVIYYSVERTANMVLVEEIEAGDGGMQSVTMKEIAGLTSSDESIVSMLIEAITKIA